MPNNRPATIIRCNRCRKRCRNMDGWNVDYIAGLVVGHICPNCQTMGEDLDAELELITKSPSGWSGLKFQPTDDHDTTINKLTTVIGGLVKTYPTPQIMRRAADELEAARSDRTAKSMVELMRGVADDMESGALWDDGEPAANVDTTACMYCGRLAPTTVDEFTTWGLATNPATGEEVGVACPVCWAERP